MNLRGFVGIVTGSLLILTGTVAAIFWFYWAAPSRRIYDLQWSRMHSAEALWIEAQKLHERTGVGPCACCNPYLGWYGDKKWLEWIITHTKKNKDFLPCVCSAGVLLDMANQMPDDSWINWWERNKTKTQEEWFKDGFAKYGVTVHIPPEESDIEPLLSLIGNSNTNKSEMIPGHVKFNAFRWLRDSDFNPVIYAVSNLTESTPVVVKEGLLRYYRREKVWPKKDNVGILAFGKPHITENHNVAGILAPKFKYMIYALIFLPLTAGVFIFFLALRQKSQEAGKCPAEIDESRY